MKKTLFLSLLFATTMLSVQKPVELPLWPDGAPNTDGLTDSQEDLEGDRVANVVNPSITVYRPAKPNGMAVIICPGGRYDRLAMNHEGHNMTVWFTTQGITYVVLKYRMPNGHHEVLLSDTEQAIRLMRGHTKKWGANPDRIDIMGTSTGGHLTVSFATLHSSDAIRPGFQVLFYPVISMLKGVTHSGSRKNLLGETPSAELRQKYSLERQVFPQTPQTFIILSADSAGVLPINGIGYLLALQEQKVPAALHVYPAGEHGWGFRDSFTYKH